MDMSVITGQYCVMDSRSLSHRLWLSSKSKTDRMLSKSPTPLFTGKIRFMFSICNGKRFKKMRHVSITSP